MRLNNTLLNKQWLIKEIWEEIKNSYNQMTVQYIILSYTAKAVLGEKFIDVEAHIRKLETFQINNLMMYSKF